MNEVKGVDTPEITDKETAETSEIDEKKENRRENIRLIIMCIIVFAVFSIIFHCFRIVNVSGSSMCDTYQDGDIVIVNSIGYSLSDKQLNRGDVIVINRTKEVVPLIKRVIAVGGDEIDIDFDTGVVKINGEVIEEDYIKEPTHLDEGAFTYPVTVDKGSYFVMGDNRNHSTDSRDPSIGFVSQNDILGKVIFSIQNKHK